MNEYLLVVDLFSGSIARAVRQLRTQAKFANLGILVATRNPADYEAEGVPIFTVQCDFSDPVALQAALAPFAPHIRGVICRGDKQVQYLRRVIPFLPSDVLVATPQSLQSATNKRLMRDDFLQHYPEITPQFVEVYDALDHTIDAIIDKLSLPVIVKPANLVSSLLIQSCHTRTELQQALRKVFDHVQVVYKREERTDQPQVIVEQYLEGDFYSIDAYIMNPDQLYYCPPVAYIPAKQLGIDDFFLYKRFVPTSLSEDEIAAANNAVCKALTAVGLTHSSAHVELVQTKSGWKIIEIGPRLGRFRRTMYDLGYGIDHSMNDVNIHLGLKPDIPKKLQKHCSAYSIYPHHEGVLQELHGLERLENDSRVYGLKIMASPGDECHFAKNGGHALAEFIIADSDPAAFAELTRYVEKEVYASIAKS